MDTPRTRESFGLSVLAGLADGFLIAGAPCSVYYLARGGMQAVLKNVPRISCYGAVFSGIYTAIDCAMVAARRREEPVLNGVVGMGGASGIMALHKGVRRAGRSALIGGAIGGVLWAGVMHLEDRRLSVSPQAQKASDAGLPARAR